MPRKKKQTPVKYRGQNVPAPDFKEFMTEWSLRQAEENHVETIEEANDFEIYEEEDDIFPKNLTVYEMHEVAEDNLAAMAPQLEQGEVESNETTDRASIETPENAHAQSAPIEPEPASPLQK